jgi:hypothetical protein
MTLPDGFIDEHGSHLVQRNGTWLWIIKEDWEDLYTQGDNMGGKPSTGTPADKRLTENKPKVAPKVNPFTKKK